MARCSPSLVCTRGSIKIWDTVSFLWASSISEYSAVCQPSPRQSGSGRGSSKAVCLNFTELFFLERLKTCYWFFSWKEVDSLRSFNASLLWHNKVPSTRRNPRGRGWSSTLWSCPPSQLLLQVGISEILLRDSLNLKERKSVRYLSSFSWCSLARPVKTSFAGR